MSLRPDLLPSAAQRTLYLQANPQRPVVLFYRLQHVAGTAGAALRQDLAALARDAGGTMRWWGEEEQVLIGPLTLGQHVARLHFADRRRALAMVESPAHAALLADAGVEIAVLNEQPRALTQAIGLMSRVLPWVPFDNTLETTPEPGLGTSVMPGESALAAFTAHPQQQTPVVMINWLKFRPQAQYAPGDDATPCSGQAAYYRYGKVAFATLHSLRARALFVSRFRQVLVGDDGDPGVGRWDEFAMVQYPGRATFKRMAALRRYRKALHHRQAGLAENGQGLLISRPQQDFIWR